jgi:hypothetical protein
MNQQHISYAIFHYQVRPIFEHPLCGYQYNPNDAISKHDNQLVAICGRIDDECFTCMGCGACIPVTEPYEEYNLLVEYLTDDDDFFQFLASEKELERLENYD